jgi:HK97 family phage portal protein
MAETSALTNIFGQEISKSQVTLTPPGGTSRWALIGPKATNDIVHYNKRQQYAVYYEMWRQHPIVRAAIDKKATFAVSGGFHFIPTDPKDKVDVEKARRLNLFFRRSNAKQLLRMTYKDLDIFGESFWLIQRSMSQTRTPLKAVRLNPRYVNPVINEQGVITKWKYGPLTPKDDPIEYDADVILHFRIEDPEDDTKGVSPLHSLEKTILIDLFAMDYTKSFYLNSAQTGVIFIVKHSDGDEAKRNREWLEQNYVGTQNAHRPILLEGDVDIQKSVQTSQDMQYLEGRVLNRREICAVLEVDETKLGIFERSLRGSGNEGEDAFHAEVVFPRQQVVEDEINNILIWKIFGWDDILFQHREGDQRRKSQEAEIQDRHQKSGRKSINEIRAEMGLGPIDGGDIHFVMSPAGIVPVHMIEKLAQMQLDAQNQVVEPLSGVGTDTGGQNPNPERAVTKKEAQSLA